MVYYPPWNLTSNLPPARRLFTSQKQITSCNLSGFRCKLLVSGRVTIMNLGGVQVIRWCTVDDFLLPGQFFKIEIVTNDRPKIIHKKGLSHWWNPLFYHKSQIWCRILWVPSVRNRPKWSELRLVIYTVTPFGSEVLTEELWFYGGCFLLDRRSVGKV